MPSLSNSQVGLHIFAPDIHSPKVDMPSFKALLHFIELNKVKSFILGGDQNDNSEISHHNRSKIILREEGSYKANTDFFNVRVLQPIEKRLHKSTKRIYIQGNHDFWEDQLVQENPELKGTVERRILLNLDKRGWQYVPLGHHYQLGRLKVVHGESIGGQNHARRALDLYACSVLYGHIHSLQVATKSAPFNQKSKHIAVCSPILGQTNPAYLKNKPTAWTSGFTLIDVQANDNFNIYPVIVSNGTFAFAGKTYGAKTTKSAPR